MVDEKQLARMEAIVLSMRPGGAAKSQLLNPAGSTGRQRRRRGYCDVNKFITQFEQSQEDDAKQLLV